jgi:hypothetical protein
MEHNGFPAQLFSKYTSLRLRRRPFAGIRRGHRPFRLRSSASELSFGATGSSPHRGMKQESPPWRRGREHPLFRALAITRREHSTRGAARCGVSHTATAHAESLAAPAALSRFVRSGRLGTPRFAQTALICGARRGCLFADRARSVTAGSRMVGRRPQGKAAARSGRVGWCGSAAGVREHGTSPSIAARVPE